MIAPPLIAAARATCLQRSLLLQTLRELGRPLGVQLHDVARAHALEELLDVLVAQTDAAVRFREADRFRLVGAVQAVAFLAQADPARADRIPRAGRDRLPSLVVRRVRHSVDDRARPD